jgi:hypothetical protein
MQNREGYVARKLAHASAPPSDAPRLTGDPKAARVFRDPDTGRTHGRNSTEAARWLKP